jgi:hypothetical protein
MSNEMPRPGIYRAHYLGGPLSIKHAAIIRGGVTFPYRAKDGQPVDVEFEVTSDDAPLVQYGLTVKPSRYAAICGDPLISDPVFVSMPRGSTPRGSTPKGKRGGEAYAVDVDDIARDTRASEAI